MEGLRFSAKATFSRRCGEERILVVRTWSWGIVGIWVRCGCGCCCCCCFPGELDSELEVEFTGWIVVITGRRFGSLGSDGLVVVSESGMVLYSGFFASVITAPGSGAFWATGELVELRSFSTSAAFSSILSPATSSAAISTGGGDCRLGIASFSEGGDGGGEGFVAGSAGSSTGAGIAEYIGSCAGSSTGMVLRLITVLRCGFGEGDCGFVGGEERRGSSGATVISLEPSDRTSDNSGRQGVYETEDAAGRRVGAGLDAAIVGCWVVEVL